MVPFARIRGLQPRPGAQAGESIASLGMYRLGFGEPLASAESVGAEETHAKSNTSRDCGGDRDAAEPGRMSPPTPQQPNLGASTMTPNPQPSPPIPRPLLALKILCGFVLLIVGVVLAAPGVPGPGIPIFLLGLWFLSDHFTWAKRLLAWVKEKASRLQRARTGKKHQAI